MHIYTKTGDHGTTALVGGTRTTKDSVRVEAYGTVDELISWIGVVRSHPLPDGADGQLRRIQECLMCAAALLAADEQAHKKLPAIAPGQIAELEQAIDTLQAALPPLKAFVLPAAPPAAAACHVARCVCRRAERRAVAIAGQCTKDDHVLPYLNRLSDYLFTLSRSITIAAGATEEWWNS